MAISRKQYNLKSVLIIDDDEIFRTLLKTFFVKLFPDAKYEFYDPVKQGAPADNFIWGQYDLLMMDYDLGNGENGLDWLRKYKHGDNFPATIMLTAHGNEEIAVDAMRFGAQDYINKTRLSLERLEQAVKNAMDKHQQQEQLSTTLNLQRNMFNKVLFYTKIKETIEKKNGGKHAFLLQIRINKYNAIYEKHGLLQTDNFVTKIITAIVKQVQNENLDLNIVRMGDAVVCCLLPDCPDESTGEKIASLVCERIKQPFDAGDDTRIESTACIGVVMLGQSANVDEILEMADKACEVAVQKGIDLYISKVEARNITTVSATRESDTSPVRQETVPPVEKIVVDIAEIIKLNSIQPYFQPYIPLSDTAANFKASYFQMRMNILLKNEKVFDSLKIGEADIKNGSPGTLDLWAARYALAQIFNMKKENASRSCGLFIRLFEESLRSNKLYEWMESLIKKTKMPNIATTLVFEIWPPDFLAHKDTALNLINKMRDTWGVSFAVFDVKNTSILNTCLKQGGFEFIKFTMNTEDINNIKEISQVASDAGALTVIEQISNAQQLNIAIEQGFDYGQGDFIQPPMDQLIMADVIEM